MYKLGSNCKRSGKRHRMAWVMITAALVCIFQLISYAFEHRAMDLVFYYINLKYNRDVRLAFEALKYLAVLLCHKKFAIEFLNRDGVQKLLDVYRPSIAATGVSLCLYYLSYFDDAMERVCLLPDHTLTTLVK